MNEFQNDFQENDVPVSKKEIQKLMKSSMLAALVVAGIFILFLFLFLLFCIFVWFR
jgi:hypothetical protein